jgi:phosphatidylglycerophosphate synthase
VAFQDLDPARRQAPRSERSLLWEANTFLARPIAALFGALGIAPGQLSLQSLTVTLVGLLRLSTGDWSHLVQGALIVYGGMLLDRADQILAAEKGSPSAWGLFLGLMVDRLVEAGLVIGLAVLAAVGVHDAPAGLRPWEFVPPAWAVVLAVAAVSAMLCARLVGAYADLLALRTHLLVIRRLPGPSAIPRRPQGVERLNRIFDRDLLVLVWVVGVVLAQVQLTLALVLLAHLAALAESVALFWSRRRDPEPQASRILGRDYAP